MHKISQLKIRRGEIKTQNRCRHIAQHCRMKNNLIDTPLTQSHTLGPP